MITAIHTLVYAEDAEAARAFFRDVLNWQHVDVHDGWLIFKTGPSELGVHPTADGGGSHHEITLMCDDITATIAELTGRGAVFTRDVRDDGFGLTTSMLVPGAGEMLLYQPSHPEAFGL